MVHLCHPSSNVFACVKRAEQGARDYVVLAGREQQQQGPAAGPAANGTPLPLPGFSFGKQQVLGPQPMEDINLLV